MNFNRIDFAGHLGRDPETRFTPSGKGVTEFSICSTRKYGEGDHRKEEATWLNCVAWDKTGENIAQYCKKGSNLFVTGYLKQEKWTDRNSGQERTALKLVVMSFQFLGAPQQAGQEAPRNRGTQQAQEEVPAADPFGDDAIPF